MPIDDLLVLVGTLSKRIDEHEVALRNSEALTRYALIDPLLRGLGWDTENPSLVVPEYREPSTNKKPDYVLFNNGKPFIVVEAKKLGENLRDTKIIEQGLRDCAFTKSSFFIITDGRLWDLYDAGRVEPKIAFDLHSAPPQACLKALALWRDSATTGDLVIAQTPVVALRSGETPPSPLPPPMPDWHPLTEVQTAVGQKIHALQLPDGTVTETKIWRNVLTEVVRWLSNKKLLTADHCPIPSATNPKYYLVNTEPKHREGEFGRGRSEIDGLHFIVGINHHRNKQIAIAIIRGVGQDPSQFKVRVS